MLLDQPGELITRDQIRARLWSNDTFVDFDHGLNAAVRRLRDALGDSAANPTYVETLPRRGYRLLAKIEKPAPDGSRVSSTWLATRPSSVAGGRGISPIAKKLRGSRHRTPLRVSDSL